MTILRILFIFFLSLVLMKYLKINIPFNLLKLLFYPLVIQTIIELPFNQLESYLPSRFCMIFMAIIFFLGYLLLQRKANMSLDTIAYVIILRLSFLLEAQYKTQCYQFHDYDPFFAFIGILSLCLIFILNTYFPLDYYLFKERKADDVFE